MFEPRVKKNLKQLKDAGIIARIGADKKGTKMIHQMNFWDDSSQAIKAGV